MKGNGDQSINRSYEHKIVTNENHNRVENIGDASENERSILILHEVLFGDASIAPSYPIAFC